VASGICLFDMLIPFERFAIDCVISVYFSFRKVFTTWIMRMSIFSSS